MPSKPQRQRGATQERRPSREELRHDSRNFLVYRATIVITSFFRYGMIALVAYFAYLSVDSLSGQETAVQAIVKGLFKARADKWVYYIVMVLFCGGWLHERRLRKAVIEREHGRLKLYEQKVDPGRSSSGLTVRGENPEEDS